MGGYFHTKFKVK